MTIWIKRPRLGFATLAVAGSLVALLGASPASAVITTALSPTFQQTSNAPCVIGNTSCANGGLVDFEASGTPGGGEGMATRRPFRFGVQAFNAGSRDEVSALPLRTTTSRP